MKGCSDIIHLAALIGIPYSYVSPTAYIKTNIEGTFNVLESAKNLSADKLFIHLLVKFMEQLYPKNYRKMTN